MLTLSKTVSIPPIGTSRQVRLLPLLTILVATFGSKDFWVSENRLQLDDFYGYIGVQGGN